MSSSEDLKDIVHSLQEALVRLDELELSIAAVKVAEALEVLSSREDDLSD